MEQELELKDIVLYLDHNVKYTLKGYVYGDYPTLAIHNIIIVLASDGMKPLLNPLSKYVNNKTGGTVMKELDCTLKIVHEIWQLHDKAKTLNQISYECIQVMARNHIDFNN